MESLNKICPCGERINEEYNEQNIPQIKDAPVYIPHYCEEYCFNCALFVLRVHFAVNSKIFHYDGEFRGDSFEFLVLAISYAESRSMPVRGTLLWKLCVTPSKISEEELLILLKERKLKSTVYFLPIETANLLKRKGFPVDENDSILRTDVLDYDKDF